MTNNYYITKLNKKSSQNNYSAPHLKPSLVVRLVPEFNISALNQGKDKELYLWYCLKSLDSAGTGRIPYNKAVSLLLEHYPYKQATLYRHLRLGDHKLWEIYRNGSTVIKIYGLKTACEYLTTCKLSKWVELQATALGKSGRKALLWNTGAYKPIGILDGYGAHPISRQSLEEKTGIYRRKQQRYDATSDTQRLEVKTKERQPNSFKLCKVKMAIQHHGKMVFVDKQLGNVYSSHAEQSNKGQLRKASKIARERIGSFVTDEGAHDILRLSRRYYHTFKDWYSAFNKGKASGEGCYYPLKSNRQVYIECYA